MRGPGEANGYNKLMANALIRGSCQGKFGSETRVEATGVVLIPMVVETFGRWDSLADEIFDLICKAAPQGAGELLGMGSHISLQTIQRDYSTVIPYIKHH